MNAELPPLRLPQGALPRTAPKRISMSEYLRFIQFARRAFPESEASRELRDRRGPRAAFRISQG